MTRIRSILFMALVGLSVLAIATAEAQQRGGPQRGGGRPEGGRPGGGGFGLGATQLLRVEKVRTEVGVTDEEMSQLQALEERSREGMRERFAKLRELSDEDRQAEMKKMGDERAKQLAIILPEAKIARLNQIQLQMSGFNALGSPEVIEKLGITPEQGEKLVAIRDSMREKSQAAMGDIRGIAGLSGEDRMKQMQERIGKLRQVQKDALKEAIETVLTTSQQETWKGMTGEPFAIEMSELMQGRGPGGPGGRGPGGRGPGGPGVRGPGGPGQ